ncbi:MAG: ParB/RepB/Spo0J family partition protein [Candidatus Omnitrophica bacterium]|nr:ParB/RepB/Spo0J family partition protein [Candidatus Omnitrophota bacterium]
MEKRALGKGLDALIPRKIPQVTTAKEFTYLSLSKIKPGKYQPRQEINQAELEELSRSIKEKGLIQPIVVRKLAEDSYEVVAGGRRFQAAKSLGLNELPTIIRELDDKDTFIFAITENLQRKDLNPIEEAEAFKRLIEEFEFTYDDIAKFVAKDKTTIVNALRLFKLPKEIQEAVKKGIISRSQARTILALESEEDQRRIFNDILREGLPVREIEKRVQRSTRKKKPADPFVAEVEDRLQKALGTKVSVFNKRNNRGKIIVEYYSLEDLERIIKRTTAS